VHMGKHTSRIIVFRLLMFSMYLGWFSVRLYTHTGDTIELSCNPEIATFSLCVLDLGWRYGGLGLQLALVNG
jgi:hypothetical protein